MNILTHQENGVVTITLNRPEKKNALTEAMYLDLSDALLKAEADVDVRVILLTGQGSAFAAGNDIGDFLAHPPQGKDSAVFRFMQVLRQVEKPVVAAVSGAAIGIGTTMLLHCDLVYADNTVRFALPFVQLGLCPEFGATLLLPRTAGYARAAEKLLLGESFDAQEACAMGLISKVLPAEDLLDFARIQANKLAILPPAAVSETKRLMKQGWYPGLEMQMDEEIRQFVSLLAQPAAQRALTAFLERPKTTGQNVK